MDVLTAIRERRSVKRFTPYEVSRREIEALLEVVTLAPNHRMTQPWRFYVLGPEARRTWGDALGARKARKIDDPEAAAAVRAKVADTHEALPALIAVAIVQDDDPEIREEDYASAWMGLQNLSLTAHAMGLGTHLKTGAVMDDPAARAAVDLADGERIVALVELGEPADVPDAKPRVDPAEITTWRS